MVKRRTKMNTKIFEESELSLRELELLDVLNKMSKIIKISYTDLNKKLTFDRYKIMELLDLEKKNPKFGITREHGISSLTLLATVTDYLTDKRLGVNLDDNNVITGFSFIKTIS